MQRLSPGRGRFTPSEKAGLLTSYRKSQLSQREFAAEAGISVSALQCWLRQARAAVESHHSSSFIALPNLLPPTLKPSFSYRLGLPGGLHLEIASGFAPAEVVELCRALRNL